MPYRTVAGQAIVFGNPSQQRLSRLKRQRFPWRCFAATRTQPPPARGRSPGTGLTNRPDVLTRQAYIDFYTNEEKYKHMGELADKEFDDLAKGKGNQLHQADLKEDLSNLESLCDGIRK